MFFGTDRISLKSLRLLRENQLSSTSSKAIKHLEVVCPKEVIEDLTVPVKQFCIRSGIPFHHPSFEIKQWEVPSLSIHQEPFDVAIVVSFGHLIPTKVLENFAYGGINMHPSLLPKYRGAAPIYHAVLNNDQETGISITEVSKNKFDVGKLLLQEKFSVDPLMTYTPLCDAIASRGAELLLQVLQDFPAYKAKAVPQPNEGASMAKKVSKGMGNIRWNQHTTQQIWNLWRALGDTVGIHTRFALNQHRLQLSKLTPPSTQPSYKNISEVQKLYQPGMLKYDKNSQILFIRTIDGWIGCSELKEDARHAVTALSFVNGYRFKNQKDPSQQYMFVDLVE